MKKLALLSIVFLLMANVTTVYALSVTPKKIVDGLKHPWSMVFLPDDEILISERSGALRRMVLGKLYKEPVSGLPPIKAVGQGGLMGLALHPDFAKNRLLYFAYASGKGGKYSTHVARGHYKNGKLTNVELLFSATPQARGGAHFGGRLLFDKRGFLYITLGDRGERKHAQEPSNHAGSLIRLNADGSIPADNPFVGQADKRPEIYSFGHRNIQGIAINPANGKVLTHEHGPRGGDEINQNLAGANFGWPVITYSREYWGDKVGEGLQKKDGMQQPLFYWTPSIAPSGMTFYDGDKYPNWQGDLFVGSLKFGVLVRLRVNGKQITEQERLFDGNIGRIRDVKQGIDGYLYVLTDANNGGLYQLLPSKNK